MQIKSGTTYWGYVGKTEVRRKVNIIETRNSGKQYVNWTQQNMNGSTGQTRWTELVKFREWAKGVFEYGEQENL